MSGDVNLTGAWVGFYQVPALRGPTHFQAELRDGGGRLSGLIREQGDTPDCAGQELHAVLEGERSGASVRFTKRYDYLRRARYAVHYQGAVADGGEEIEGVWTIPGDWSGTFMMVRAPRVPAEAEVRARQSVPVEQS